MRNRIVNYLFVTSLLTFYVLFIIIVSDIVGLKNHWVNQLFSEQNTLYISLFVLLSFIMYIAAQKNIESIENLRWKKAEYIIHATGAIAFLIVLIESNNVRKIKENVDDSLAQIDSIGRQITNVAQHLPSRELKNFPKNIDEMVEIIKSTKDTLTIYTDAPAYGCYTDPVRSQAYEDAINNLIHEGKTVFLFHPCKKMFDSALINQFLMTKKIKDYLGQKLIPDELKKFTFFIAANKDEFPDNRFPQPTYRNMFDAIEQKDSIFISKLKKAQESCTSKYKGKFYDSTLHVEVENGFWIIDRNKILYSFISKDTSDFTEPMFYAENSALIQVAMSKIREKSIYFSCFKSSDSFGPKK